MSKYGLNHSFAVAPSDIDVARSRIKIPYNRKCTYNFGEIVPVFCKPMVPGDTFTLRDMKSLTRLTTPLRPVMDNAYLDTYVIAVPYRLCWDNWEAFLGENKDSEWVADFDKEVPHDYVKAVPGGLFDHLGLPCYSHIETNPSTGDTHEVIDSPTLDVNILKARAYWLIYNRYFRAETVSPPKLVNLGDEGSVDQWTYNQDLLKASRFPDVFSTALPAPQMGDAVDIPLLGLVPVIQGEKHSNISFAQKWKGLAYQLGNGQDQSMGTQFSDVYLSPALDPHYESALVKGSGKVGVNRSDTTSQVPTKLTGDLYLTNLHADLAGATAVNISDLRYALAVQRIQELRGRTGSRYQSIILASFGVTVPDARAQEPEFVFGDRTRINMQQVAQTSNVTDQTQPLGFLGAYSQTWSASSRIPQYTATEHCYLFILQVARIARTYQQGLDPEWMRRDRYDFYWREFAHISEQPVKRWAIYADGTGADENVFGYQEAWWDYRYFPNEVTGRFRSTVANNFDEWHWADYYTSAPVLSHSWMAEGTENVARTLAITDEGTAPQLYTDFVVTVDAVRPMPVFSTPGLTTRV